MEVYNGGLSSPSQPYDSITDPSTASRPILRRATLLLKKESYARDGRTNGRTEQEKQELKKIGTRHLNRG